jgi:hypothetical protein
MVDRLVSKFKKEKEELNQKYRDKFASIIIKCFDEVGIEFINDLIGSDIELYYGNYEIIKVEKDKGGYYFKYTDHDNDYPYPIDDDDLDDTENLDKIDTDILSNIITELFRSKKFINRFNEKTFKKMNGNKWVKTFENFTEIKEIIWIHGLPGSGKTYKAKEIKNENPEKNYKLLDDIGSIKLIEEQMGKSNNIILSSPFFEEFFPLGREFKKKLDILLEKYNYELIEYWFENDVEACFKNILSRKDHDINNDDVIGELPYLHKNYKIPQGANIIPVFKNKN